MSEKEVFVQEVSDEEMEAVAGGEDQYNCYNEFEREIYVPSFPNCAATVEEASWCGTNDACAHDAVGYLGMFECDRAWK